MHGCAHPDIGRPEAAARFHYGYVVLGLIVLAVFASLGLARHGYTSILPAMQDALKLSNTQTGQLQSWNLLGYLLTVVFAGLLAARFGARIVIAIALVVASLGMLLTGLVPTFEGARWGRFLAGVGGAGANVPAMAHVASWFGMRRRGLASGIAVAGSSLGLMVTGPLVPGLLKMNGPESWRTCWYVLGGMGLLVAVLCAFFLRSRPAEMGLVPIGDSSLEKPPRNPAPTTASLGWATVYKSRLLWHLACIYLAFGFSYIIYATFFIRCLVKEGNFTAASAGLLWFKIGICSCLSGFLWGSISDRWSRKLALLCVFTLQGASFLLLGSSLESWAVYLSAGLFALTAWSVPALMAALSGDIFGARLAPAALGLMTIVFGAGQALGPWFAGWIADVQHSFSWAFITAGLVALILGAGGTLLLSSRVMDTHKN